MSHISIRGSTYIDALGATYVVLCMAPLVLLHGATYLYCNMVPRALNTLLHRLRQATLELRCGATYSALLVASTHLLQHGAILAATWHRSYRNLAPHMLCNGNIYAANGAIHANTVLQHCVLRDEHLEHLEPTKIEKTYMCMNPYT